MLITERSQTQRTKLREFLGKVKEENGCMDCRKEYPYYVLDFDHVRGEKTHSISYMCRWYTLEEISEEMQKCEIVCSNCHRKRTRQRMESNNVSV